MMLGARTAAWAKAGGVPTARDYVQDGLIAMWDGIENAGLGIHDSGATTWKDLSGDYDAILTDVGSFDSNSLVCNGGERMDGKSYESAYCPAYNFLGNLDYCSTEIVWKLTSRWGTNLSTIGPQILFSLPPENGSSNNFICYCAYPEASTDNTRLLAVPPYGSKEDSVVVLFNEIQSISYANSRFKDSGRTRVQAFLNSKIPQLGITTGGRDPDLTNIAFGGRHDVGVYGMSGNIYCVRVYNRILDHAEISANYEIDKARFNLT